jgi:hypothetical protein
MVSRKQAPSPSPVSSTTSPSWGLAALLLHRGVPLRGAMLSAFVRGLPDHLTEQGEAWLVVSDLVELLGLRDPGALPGLVRESGLIVRYRIASPPTTRHERDDDPLAELRRRETIMLWRLGR